MRKLVPLLLLLIMACGGKQAPVGDDATVLPRCAAPVSGTTVTLRKIGQVVGGALLVTAPRDDLRLFVIEQRG
ncbi:MAG: hypothetical protein H6Q90_6432, partial [Deltaproteobacteria bacterium]|nr:hypothetical protein [Deltaproteobacteria bacterium]